MKLDLSTSLQEVTHYGASLFLYLKYQHIALRTCDFVLTLADRYFGF